MNKVTDELLRLVADFKGEFTGAYNIREDGCAGRQSTKNIKIESKTDKPGIDIRVAPGTKRGKRYISRPVSHTAAWTTWYTTISTSAKGPMWWWWPAAASMQTAKKRRATMASTAFLWARAPKWFMRKSMGTGASTGNRHIDPVTEAFLEEDSSLTMDTVQFPAWTPPTARQAPGWLRAQSCWCASA